MLNRRVRQCRVLSRFVPFSHPYTSLQVGVFLKLSHFDRAHRSSLQMQCVHRSGGQAIKIARIYSAQIALSRDVLANGLDHFRWEKPS